MKQVSQLKMGALISYLSIFINIAAGLLYTPWMVAQIGQSHYGLYTLANSLITLFMVDFGLSSATARYVSKYRAEGNEEKVRNFLGIVYKLYLLIDAVIFVALIVVFVFIDQIYVNLTPDELAQFRVIYVIVAVYSVINFPFVTLNGILTSYEKFIQLKLADILYRVAVVGLTVTALLSGMGLYALVTVNAVAGLMMIAYKLIVIRKTTPVTVNFRYNERSMLKDLFGFSVWVTVDSIAQRLIFAIVPTILGILSNSAEIAVFGVVTTIEGYSYTLTGAINGMFMPRISKIVADDGSTKNILPLMIKVGRFQYALNGLIIVGFAVVGQLFIRLWMGEAYSDAYYGILLVMIPGMFYNALQIGNTTIVVTKNVHLRAYVSLASGLTNVILSVILARHFGVIGACFSIFVAYTIRVVALCVLYHKKMQINILAFIKACYLKMSVPLVMTLALSFGIIRVLPGGTWGHLVLQGGILVAVYVVMVALFGLTAEERRAIAKKLKLVKS